MTEEQRQKKREKDRERIAKKRAEQKAASSLDMQTPQEQIEKAPETAMQVPELSLFDYHKHRMEREAKL